MGLRHLGARIKAGRERRSLTQNELATRAGVSRIYIAKLEGGDRQSPSLPVLDRIARVLGVSVADLLK